MFYIATDDSQQQDDMEVTALCIRLMMTVLFLLAAQDEVSYSTEAYADFPQIDPNRQQFFQYEPLVVSCEGLMGLSGWRVLKKVKGGITPCSGSWETSTGPCRIHSAFPSVDDGEYWCEMGARRSNSINITVTAGSVILESPVLPVTEGDNVTLGCRTKPSDSNVTAQFFKDGLLMENSLTGTMTIHSVSRSNEGLYKCSISKARESPQSWLTVRALQEDPPSPEDSKLLWICIGVCIFLLLLLLVVGLLRFKSCQSTTHTAASPPSVQSSPPTQTASNTACNDDCETSYSFVNKPKKKEESKPPCTDDSMFSTYAVINIPMKRSACQVKTTRDTWKPKQAVNPAGYRGVGTVESSER
ncbi:low affinity immunoglobulin gamma Fc region receptor II-a-like [Notolabrus celidotus]|uniref:low affinity immunoglobulin gamma Fc region receptor II-a-like n=1 Tax=Notolabrus celidotus TaxID=1203425 RepID=UPI00149063D1|nr:low affinity immunoglobulin gamma Fc region receptor II-a-like [Notolabrus celidotus]